MSRDEIVYAIDRKRWQVQMWWDGLTYWERDVVTLIGLLSVAAVCSAACMIERRR